MKSKKKNSNVFDIKNKETLYMYIYIYIYTHH